MKRVLVAITALCFFAASCGGSNESDTSDSSTSTTAGESPDDGGASATAGGEIRLGASQGIPQLNPAIRTFDFEKTLFSLMWSGLTRPAPDGGIEPDLATEWSTSDGGLTWDFTLREGAKFSDGSEIGVDDVVATFEYYLDPEVPTQARSKWGSVSHIEATGDNSIRVTMNEPNQWFADAIVDVKILKMDALDTIDTDPVVSGPFMVESFTPNSSLSLVPNPEYYGEAPLLEKITILAQPDATASLTALQSGDVDVVWGVSNAFASDIEAGAYPDLKLLKPNGTGQSPFWNLDVASPPFDDVNARLALAYATDRETIAEVAYEGQASASPTNNFLVESNPWFADGLTEFEYDLDKAQELFTEAGVAEGDTLTWWGVSGAWPEWNTTGQILQASLAEIGINLEIENNEIGTWAAKFYPSGKVYPAMIVPNLISFPPSPAFSLAFYAEGTCPCNWTSPEFAETFVAAVSEPSDPSEASATEAWGEVQRVLNEEIPMIVPVYATSASGAQADVEGVWLETGSVLHLENAWRS